MSRRRWSQLRAVLLLAVFLSAGSSLPSLDALVYHTEAWERPRSQAHIEPTGGCLDHGQHCGLGRTAPGAGALAPTGTEVRVAPLTPPAGPSTAPTLVDSGIAGAPNSRAPPVPLA